MENKMWRHCDKTIDYVLKQSIYSSQDVCNVASYVTQRKISDVDNVTNISTKNL